MKKIFFLLLICSLSILLYASSIYSQEEIPAGWESQSDCIYCYKVQFLNADIGFMAAVIGNQDVLRKTTDRGTTWNNIWNTNYYWAGFTFEAINSDVIKIYCGNSMYRTSNGGQNWSSCSLSVFGSHGPRSPLVMKFFNQNTGYATYTDNDNTPNPVLKFIKTTDGGSTWQQTDDKDGFYRWVVDDMAFIGNDPNHVICVGSFRTVTGPESRASAFFESTNGIGFGYSPGFMGVVDNQYHCILPLPQNNSDYSVMLRKSNKENPGDPENGLYNRMVINGNYTDYKISDDASEQVGGLSLTSNSLGYVYQGTSVYRTSNSGTNWQPIVTGLSIAPTYTNCVSSFRDICYLGSNGGAFITKLLNTNIYGVSDNVTNLNTQFIINGNTTSIPYNNYMRGGTVSFEANGYINDKVFYRWSNNSMNSSTTIYFDNDNAQITGYYKSKQIADNQWAINNPAQTKALRDTSSVSGGIIHQVHESIGGVFYTRSTDGGISYVNEEIVNKDVSVLGNRNPFVGIKKCMGGTYPLTILDANKNVAIVWERFNYTTNQTEIQLSDRVLNIPR